MRKADDLIQRFLDSIGQSEGAVYVGLFRSWESIVGERISAHAQPVDLRGHNLVIQADHPGWVQMVMMSRNKIIRELNKRFPELRITGLSVRVTDRPGGGSAGAVKPPAASRRTSRAAGPSDTDEPSEPPPPPTRDENEALKRIEDEELRDTLARLRNDLDETDDDES